MMPAESKYATRTAALAAGAALLLLLALLLPACTSNPGAGGLTDSQGRHSAAFVASHRSFAGAGGEPCRECHGDDLRGGIARVSCFDNSGLCHASGPAFHPADWLATHRTAALADSGESCKACHGADLRGAGGVVSCYTATFGGVSCHANGPAFHPASWLDCTAPGNSWHGTAYGNNVPICSNCHDVTSTSPKCTLTCHFTLGGGRIPPALSSTWSHGTGTPGTASSHHQPAINDNAAVKAVCVNCHDTHNSFGHGPVCHNCHDGVSNPHPTGWLLSHDTPARTSTADCSTASCHGVSLEGAAGRACAACHKGEALLAHLSDCRSCHGNPPPGTPPLSQPTGEPNVAGAHARHGALPGGAGAACSACHTGAGLGTANHFDNAADVFLSPTFNARNGGPARAGAGRTCLAVSCHGGKATPDWRTVDSALRGTGTCSRCHNTALATASTAQWNDWTDTPMSHSRHVVGEGLACTACHDTTRMPNSLHFATLATTAMSSADAISTLYTDLAYAGNGQECGGSRASGFTCHGGD